MALFAHRFATDPTAGMASVEDPAFVPAARATFVNDDDYVVGLTFGDKSYAYPYAALYSTPAVVHAQHDKRVLVMWSAPANRAVAVTITRAIRARFLDVVSTPGSRTEEGLRSNINVGIQYISSWLRGNGAAGIYGLMEDAATAEIARGQVWQWIRHEAELDDGRTVTPDLVRELATSELEKIRVEIGDDEWFEKEGRPDLSRSLSERVALSDEFVEFLTLPAYEELQKLEH